MPELLPNMKASIVAYELFKETGDFQML